MRNWRFESEVSRFFELEEPRELARIKNVIESSILRHGSGARSAKEYELTSNVSID
jgi:hypothetical protein